MTDLVDELRISFEESREEHSPSDEMRVITSEDELAPGFMGMKDYFEKRLVVVARRGYRHHAGAPLQEDHIEAIKQTTSVMMNGLLASAMGAFSAGVAIGQRENHLIQMWIHFNAVDHVFHDDDTLNAIFTMAKGFADAPGVTDFFKDYISGALSHVAHVTGFAHSPGDVNKIWDVWLMTGTACVTASYLAGYRLGSTWRDRDVLDGIMIATEEGMHGPAGTHAPDRGADEGNQD